MAPPPAPAAARSPPAAADWCWQRRALEKVGQRMEQWRTNEETSCLNVRTQIRPAKCRNNHDDTTTVCQKVSCDNTCQNKHHIYEQMSEDTSEGT